jgi:hypothetical protein
VRRFLKRFVPLWAGVCCLLVVPELAAQLSFSNQSEAAGAAFEHGYNTEAPGGETVTMPMLMSAGVAAGDYDRDGDTDLYVITGSAFPNVLLNNLGNGTFTNVAAAAGVDQPGVLNGGPVFGDIDGDGWPDLLTGSLQGSGLRVFRNLRDGTFAEVTTDSGIVTEDVAQNDYSIAMGDPDSDGDLDLYIGHWGTPGPSNHFWMNDGSGRFVQLDDYAGVSGPYQDGDYSFAPAFADVDGDGRQDLLVTSDFETSHTLMNRGGLHFENTTTAVIDDQAGMGSAIGDFDNDGDMDWFVTAIWWNEEKEGEGNRLYANDGEGNFINVTEDAGVLEGDWGWGACSQDFDNDGWLDLFHVNGMNYDAKGENFFADPSRLFINKGDGTFTEQATALGLEDTGLGKGVVCFDADQDGDIDIFTSNVQGPSQFYRNDLAQNPGWLQVRLEGELNNPSAVAARIELTAGGLTQLREVRVGSNYQSQDSLLQHFGLGGAALVDELKVTWPHGGVTVLNGIQPNQQLTLTPATATPPPFFMQPGISAAWVNPALSKEGFVIEIMPNGLAVVFWFTYDLEGNQDWYIGVGTINGRRIFFNALRHVSGAHFGVDTVPEQITETIVGRAAFTWTGCDSGFMDWEIGEAMGQQPLVRLTRMMGAACDETLEVPAGPQATWSGAWVDPQRDGEGFTLEILENGLAVIFYFGFDADGNRRWLLGVGQLTDGKLVFDNMLTTSGGRFVDPANASQAQELPWGTLEIEMDCSGGAASFSSTEPGFGDGVYAFSRLTAIDGLPCIEVASDH